MTNLKVIIEMRLGMIIDKIDRTNLNATEITKMIVFLITIVDWMIDFAIHTRVVPLIIHFHLPVFIVLIGKETHQTNLQTNHQTNRIFQHNLLYLSGKERVSLLFFFKYLFIIYFVI